MFFLYEPDLLYSHGWLVRTRRRAVKDHAHKKAVRKQKQHLKRIKSKAQLREMRNQSRRKQR